MPAPFRLYNTLSRKVEDFQPVREGHVGIYVCGMTVYDHIHVGHARAMVVFDSFVLAIRITRHIYYPKAGPFGSFMAAV